MDNQLFKKVDYYWIFLILTIVLCYGFFLTNHSMGIDDEIFESFASTHTILVTNRPGNFIFSDILKTYEYLPFWREFLGIALYAIGITLHAENFIKYLSPKFDKKAATIFSVIAISFPYLAFHFFFMQSTIQRGFIMIATAFAVRFLYKGLIEEKISKKNIFISGVLMFLAASVYETAVYYFAIACLFIEILKLIDGQLKQNYIRLFLIGLLAFIAVFFNAVLSSICKLSFGIIHSKVEQFMLYDFSSFSGFINSFINSLKDFIHLFFQTASYNNGTVISIILISVFMIGSIIYSFKQKNINVFLYALIMSLIPFATFILLGNITMPFRAYATLSFLNAMILVLIYICLKERKVIVNVLFWIVALVVVYQAQELNQIFYTEHLKFQKDKFYAYELMYDIKKLGLENKPIIFVGTVEDIKLRHNYIESPELNISSFNWDRYDSFESEISVNRPYGFLRELGFDVKDYTAVYLDSMSEYDTLINEIKTNTKNMDIYPRENSIKDFDKYVIIKIGESKADTE